LPWGALSTWGEGALRTFPCRFGPEKCSPRPGGARAPSAPPGYAYELAVIFHITPLFNVVSRSLLLTPLTLTSNTNRALLSLLPLSTCPA